MSSTENSFPWFWVALGVVGGWVAFTDTGRELFGAGARAGFEASKTAISEIPSPVASRARQVLPAVPMSKEMVLNKGLKRLSKDLKKCLDKKERNEFRETYVASKDYALDMLDDKCLAPERGKPKGSPPKNPLSVGWKREGEKRTGGEWFGERLSPIDANRVDVHFYTMGVPPKQEIKVSLDEIGKWLATNQKPEAEKVRGF